MTAEIAVHRTNLKVRFTSLTLLSPTTVTAASGKRLRETTLTTPYLSRDPHFSRKLAN